MKLAELCLGKWYYEAAMIFRNSLLLSTLLTNLESWYSCTAKDIIDLEKIVKYYWGKKWMRQPKHQLRLYTWNWEPRLLSSFSWWGDSCTWTTCHMMKEDEDSMLYRVLQSQIEWLGPSHASGYPRLEPKSDVWKYCKDVKYQMKAILREAVKKEERSFQIFKWYPGWSQQNQESQIFWPPAATLPVYLVRGQLQLNRKQCISN